MTVNSQGEWKRIPVYRRAEALGLNVLQAAFLWLPFFIGLRAAFMYGPMGCRTVPEVYEDWFHLMQVRWWIARSSHYQITESGTLRFSYVADKQVAPR